MLVAGHPGGLQVTVMDGDVISPSNCVRQPFCQSEIGLFKAVVMVNRLNLFWGLRWGAVPEHLTEAIAHRRIRRRDWVRRYPRRPAHHPDPH
jgi:hypothetical protein